MSDEEQQTTEENASAAPDRAGQRRVVLFVVAFVVLVFGMLAGYRFAIPTRPNDWYLFKVAGHTAWLLSLIGESSTLENPERFHETPALVRASVEAWRRGEPAPEALPPETPPGPPLTAWDSWQHRAWRMRYEGRTGHGVGPLVQFVLREGLNVRIDALRQELHALGEAGGPPDETARRRQSIETRLAQLEEELKAAKAEDDMWAGRSVAFAFTVVPDCGAIPSMAIFVAAVLAFPTAWRKRLLGLVLGLPILYVVNLLRLSCLAVLGAADHGGKWFQFAHHYVWQGIFIVFVVAVWMAWIELIVRREKT